MASNTKSLPSLYQHLKSHFCDEFFKKSGWFLGYNWLTIGGEYYTREFVSHLGLRPGQRVLDVGCGTGESAFYMARHYGVHVHGVDILDNVIRLAEEEKQRHEEEVQQKVIFDVANIMTADLEDGSYDMVYSRDCLLYVQEKENLFKKFYRLLKPGGSIFMTDYCAGPGPNYTDDFIHYSRIERRFHLGTVAYYEEKLKAAGFVNVKAKDHNQQFLEIHEREHRIFETMKEAFILTYSKDKYDHLLDGWSRRMEYTREGQMTWGVFTAHKEPST